MKIWKVINNMEEMEELKEKKEEKGKICQGITNYVKCDKPATWKVIGYSAQFGVPHSAYVCVEHKDYMEKHPHPKIMEYNRFDVKIIPLNLGECCGDMEQSIEMGFLTIKNEEIVFNIVKTPKSAGNVLTGETFDPKNYPISMSLQYCPFCSSQLSYFQKDEW